MYGEVDPVVRSKAPLPGSTYRRFAATGSGPRVRRASDRLAEIADELKEIGQP